MAISESFFGDCILDLLSIPDRPVDIIFFSIFKRWFFIKYNGFI